MRVNVFVSFRVQVLGAAMFHIRVGSESVVYTGTVSYSCALHSFIPFFLSSISFAVV